MHHLYIALILFGISLSYADEASDFCAQGPPGRYCTNDLSGYYVCTGQSASTVQCSTGKQCACFVGPDCANVEGVGQGDPCQDAPTLPQFTDLLSVFRNTTTTISGRTGSTTTSVYEQISSHRSFERFRIDTVTENRTEVLAIDIYYGESNDNLHYHFDSATETCAADSQPIPFFGIPSGYRYFNNSAIDGQEVNVYFYRAGGHNNGESTVYAQFFTTLPDANGFVVPILNTIARNSPQAATSERTIITYSNAVSGPTQQVPSFPSSYWNPPAICLSANGSTSGSNSSSGEISTGDSSSSTGSSTSGEDNEACPVTGNMRCVGDSTYQTCDRGTWQTVQSCQDGLLCEVSGDNIYCVRPPQSTGTSNEACSTAGHMRCVGNASPLYQTCDHGFWQAAQSCQSGLDCTASGDYIYCIPHTSGMA